MKKAISLLLSLLTVCSVLSGVNLFAYADTYQVGENVTAVYDAASKTLTLSGSGDTEDYSLKSPFLNEFQNISDIHIVIEEGITGIGDNLFNISGNAANTFTAVSFPRTLERIGKKAFVSTAVTEFNVPAGVTSIGDDAFRTAVNSSKKLYTNAINVDSANPVYSSVDGVLYNKERTLLIQAPSNLASESGTFTVPKTVKTIGRYAFFRCLNLTSVELPATVESIEAFAFSSCINLTEITYPTTSTKAAIDVNAFRYSNGGYVLNNNAMTFYVCEDSGAMLYAQNNGISYELTEAPQPFTGWYQLGKIWYYFKEDIIQTGWVKVGSTWYYLNEIGEMQTGWVKLGSVWYYLKPSGAMVTGWQKLGGVWYYFKSSGAMATGWVKVGNYWYYMKASGAMQTGWLKLSGKWYYLEPKTGAMRTANLLYKGKTYRFNKSGVCLNP